MPAKPRRAHLDRDNCDRRMRKFIVARGSCERCGIAGVPLECAHIIRRRYSWTRTDERNAWALCRTCHQAVDTYASHFNALVAKTIGWDLLAELEAKSMWREKFDWKAELERWKAMA